MDEQERRFKELELEYKTEMDRYAIKGIRITKKFIKWISKNYPSDLALISRKFISRKYINSGVDPKDAVILGILEILIDEELSEACEDMHTSYVYQLDEKGRVISLSIFNVRGARKSILNFFPREICELSELRSFRFGFDGDIPPCIEKLTKLGSLSAYCNRIDSIPASIGNLEDLMHLSLSHVGLKTIPKTIGKLKSLLILDLAGNEIETLPNSMSKLTNLMELDVSENRLNSLPASLQTLSSLKKLRVSGNPELKEFKKIPNSMP